MSLCPYYFALGCLSVLAKVKVGLSDEDQQGTNTKRAWACYGNYRNFLDISCPPDRQVELLSMMNGAKPTNQNCPFMMTAEDNFRQECCSFDDGDCVIQTHRNNFPVECSHRHYCQPQSRLAGTGPTCNTNYFPKFTHYTEITYRCVASPATTTAKTTTSTTMLVNKLAALAPDISVNTTTVSTTTTIVSNVGRRRTTALLHTRHIYVEEVIESDNFAPAMIGGMVAGIVGLMLTIFIFMFYWGRKRQLQITTPARTQSSVWDFLLANTMSVRAFRGYDNFSSHSHSTATSTSSSGSTSSRQSVTSEDGPQPPGRRGGRGNAGATWLPNISVDSGQGESNLTSDDNCSIITVDRGVAAAFRAGGSMRGKRGGGSAFAQEDGNASDSAASGIILVVNRL